MKTPFLFDFEKIVLDGGKHKGETIGFVAATDPRYLVWAWFSEASALVMAVPAWYIHSLRNEAHRKEWGINATWIDDIDYGEHDDAGDRD